jgi:hypothetical protein
MVGEGRKALTGPQLANGLASGKRIDVSELGNNRGIDLPEEEMALRLRRASQAHATAS